MDDFHKPTLDAIGFQELITEEAAAWNTELDEDYTPKYQSLGKQPSWIEYTTDVNETSGSSSSSSGKEEIRASENGENGSSGPSEGNEKEIVEKPISAEGEKSLPVEEPKPEKMKKKKKC